MKYQGMFNTVKRTLKNGIMMTLIAILMTITLLGIEVYAATGIANSKNEDTLVRLAAAKAMAQNSNRSFTRDQVATIMGNYVSSSSITVTDYTEKVTVKYNGSGNTYTIYRGKTYTVTYNANGGSGAPAAQTKLKGTNLTLSSTKPTRSNYTFLGWYPAEYKDHPLYYYADTYSDLKEAFGYDEAKLYNHWINNGKGEGRKIAPYSPGGTYTADSGITLYAGWQKNDVVILGSNASYSGSFIQYTAGYAAKGGTFTNNGTSLVLECKPSYSNHAGISTTFGTVAVNLTNVKTIEFKYSNGLRTDDSGDYWFGVTANNLNESMSTTSYSNPHCTEVKANTIRPTLAAEKQVSPSAGASGTVSVDVSGLSGNYYIVTTIHSDYVSWEPRNGITITQITLKS